MHSVRRALWPLSLLVGLGALALILTSNHDDTPAANAALTLLLGFSFSVSGLVAWTRRPENRFGALMVAAGFASFLTAANDANDSLVFTLGFLASGLVFAILAHLLLAFPRGALESRIAR